MKICGIICEFNPFHNGHEYLIKKAKELSGCDVVICIMSGCFTQRGDICIADKFLRAKHAVLSGADCVLELPSPFAVAPAEIFAEGAVKILSAISRIDTLAFGCESCTAEDFFTAAQILLNESANFKKILNNKLSSGESYIKSYITAFGAVGGNTEILSRPNNILGTEYAKSILKHNLKIKLLPVERVGSSYNDCGLKHNFSSASAIRCNLSSPLVKNNLPEYVFNDLNCFFGNTQKYEDYLKLILSRTEAKDLNKVYGCNEGLENALKSMQDLPFSEIIEKTTSKRYSSSRIKRILCANFLNLQQNETENYLKSDLYLFPLAVKKEKADKIFSALCLSDFPLLTSGSDLNKLSPTALRCKNSDDFAYSQWRQITDACFSGKLLTI